jgi:hypothetical protein
MSELDRELRSAGGAVAPAGATARLRGLLLEDLDAGRAELVKARSGYDSPVTVAMALTPDGVVGVVPVSASLRADTAVVGERAWLLVAATVAALVELSGVGKARTGADLCLRAGTFAEDHLALAMPARSADAADLDELAPLAFLEHAAPVDRLRAHAVAVPALVLEGMVGGLRPPIGSGHPLRIAEAVARLGGRPARPRSVQDNEEQVLALLAVGGAGAVRPHEDPDTARRIARRILQRLDGMGKWGGYHTEFAHLPRGFAGNERALAQEVGESLLAAGLLAEKPSVGQRHVFLNPRRAAEIRRLIDTGSQPPELRLPRH